MTGTLEAVAAAVGVDVAALLAVSAGVAAAVLVIALGLIVMPSGVLRRRIELAAGTRAHRREVAAGSGRRTETALTVMRGVVKKLKLAKDNQTVSITRSLARAGWRSRDALTVYLFIKAILPIMGAGAAFFAVVPLGLFDLSQPMKVAAVLAGALVGSYSLDLVIRNRAQKRMEEIRKVLPDALDLMVICTDAGLSLDASVSRVAGEIEPSSPVLADELHLTSTELRFLPSRRDALEHLSDRVDLPSVQALTNTLIQTERYGTPLSQALRVLSREQRTERMLRAEEKAARLPAIMTVPLIIFILPALFIVLMGPAIMSILDTLTNL